MKQDLQFLIDRGYQEDIIGDLKPKGTRFFFKTTGLGYDSIGQVPNFEVYFYPRHFAFEMELTGCNQETHWIVIKIYGGVLSKTFKESIEKIEKDLIAAWLAVRDRK